MRRGEFRRKVIERGAVGRKRCTRNEHRLVALRHQSAGARRSQRFPRLDGPCYGAPGFGCNVSRQRVVSGTRGAARPSAQAACPAP